MKIKEKEIKIIGHRGTPALIPENTLLGLAKALELGCEMIEIDARISKDGEVVLIHDLTLDRTTNGKGRVAYKSLAELKKLDAGKGEKIPTLKEAWDLIKGRAELNVEIKDRKKETFEEVASFIKKENIKEDTLISSKYCWLLAKIKKSNPFLRTGFVSYLPIGSIWQALKCGAESLHPLFFIVTPNFVRKAHQNDLKVYPFPLGIKKEDPKKIEELIEMDIDGIFLNDPATIEILNPKSLPTGRQAKS